MFRREQFGIVFNTVFSIVFSAALTFFVKFMNGQLTFETFLMGFVPSFAINFVLGSYIPLVKVGNAFAGIFIKDEKNPVFYFLRIFMIVLIMTAAMSFLVMFSEMGFTKVLLVAFIASFPATFVFAYIVGVVVFPFLFKMTQTLCVKE
ncbi:hypothetical protein ACQRBN_13145 [Bariatricus sp. SGI.154]|uniref:hypothetical protein n=1 Tax=Bariatricus sp. SGI.154 TaxID=3420549 RepID=UPI003D018103